MQPPLGLSAVQVRDIDFEPQVGREQGGNRPALVISNDHFNRAPNGLLYVVPIMCRVRGLRYHVRVTPPERGLTVPSVIMCDQAKASSDQRMLRRRGLVTVDTLEQVRRMEGECIDR